MLSILFGALEVVFNAFFERLEEERQLVAAMNPSARNSIIVHSRKWIREITHRFLCAFWKNSSASLWCNCGLFPLKIIGCFRCDLPVDSEYQVAEVAVRWLASKPERVRHAYRVLRCIRVSNLNAEQRAQLEALIAAMPQYSTTVFSVPAMHGMQKIRDRWTAKAEEEQWF